MGGAGMGMGGQEMVLSRRFIETFGGTLAFGGSVAESGVMMVFFRVAHLVEGG
jgi:hypothetical protein